MKHDLMPEIESVIRTRADIDMCEPFDVLWSVSPELAAVAYANRKEILTPEILAYSANFCKLSTEQKIALMREITNRMAIEADVYKHNTAAENAVILQKLKYDARMQMVRDQEEGKKYLSDNQLKAAKIEADAYREAAEFASQMHKDALLGMSQNESQTRVYEAELLHERKMQEAANLRFTRELRSKTQVMQSYMQFLVQQKQISLMAEVRRDELRVTVNENALERNARRDVAYAQVDREGYRTIGKCMTEAAKLLRERGGCVVEVKAEIPQGSISLEMRIKD